jgi:hypothetical protein
MLKFNKKQKEYLNEVVDRSTTKLELADTLFRDSSVEDRVASLGKTWESQWSDIDSYVNDRFNEVHGAGMMQPW